MAKRKMKHGGARKGAGRKPLGETARSVVLRFLSTPAEARQWRAAARKAKVTLSEYVRDAVEKRIMEGR